MHCALYDAGRCRSCQWLELPPEQQLADKMADLRSLLAERPVATWCEPVSGPEAGFRNKAKMVVSGSVERPLLGMLHRDGNPEDLTDCPLYPASFAPVFALLKPFIARAGLHALSGGPPTRRAEVSAAHRKPPRRRHDAALCAAL
ncbi:23S rRNA (uracil(747)-C(5))-methyltransferase RlmC [Raoultella terrigena]|uniref:23S rRNA (Uracil(747)-C(5))-methyltransferase RlmC n=1 Tax=Raoultella terrigena TaxID=577 RepID=A0A4U9DCD1_RAOTE|nr:23S rRNA (uracil(747)-C(5))-methyltransferase RlmC [Raoultella terrigena]